MKKGYPTKRVSIADPVIPGRYPPAIGKWAGWDWNTFYMAILTILDKPAEPYNYQRALEAVQNLPDIMVFTTPVMASAWARFCRCFPQRDNSSAYRYMINLLQTTNRLVNDSVTDWSEIENEWKSLETGEGQLQGVFQNIGTMSDISYQVRGLYFLQVIPDEYKHPGTGRYVGSYFIPDMIPYSASLVGAYESGMADANTMNEFVIAGAIDSEWDYYSKTTSEKLKPYHLANMNGFYRLYLIKTNQVAPPTIPSEIQAVKTGYTFTVNSSSKIPIMIDGVFCGYPPVKIKVGQGFLPDVITPGPHNISAASSGYAADVQTVIIPSDRNSSINMSPTLIPKEEREKTYYKLYFTSNPPGATIIVDNKDTGLITNTYLRVDDTHVKPGKHYCRIEKPGYIAWNGSIDVNSGQDTNLIFDLQKEPEPLPDPLAVVDPIVIVSMAKYKVISGKEVKVIHPNTFDAIVSESASMAAQASARPGYTIQNWMDTAYNSLLMKNVTRGYVPSMQEIYQATDTFCYENLTGKGIPIGQGFDTLDGSLYDEIVINTAKKTSDYFLKKTGLNLTKDAMAFFQNDAKESLAFFGFKRGK